MRVARYRVHRAFVIVLVAAGIATGSAVPLVATVVPLAVVVQGAVARTPAVEDAVRVTREIHPETPLPGQSIEVTLTVENVGDHAIPDCRIVDGVPDELGVVDGRPRGGATLLTGDSTTVTYTVVGDRGAYEFDPVAVRARSFGGVRQRDVAIEAAGTAAIECRVSADDLPIDRETMAYAGQLPTDAGGPGIEFYATREYRPGDPIERIDWRQFAETRSLATVDYREQRAVHVSVVVDSRPGAHVAPDRSRPTGATLSAYAGTLAVGVLLEEGHHVSVGALGCRDPIDGRRPAWVPARSDSFGRHAAAVCNAAATGGEHATRADPLVADGGRESDRLRGHIPGGAQVLFCTPARDDGVVSIVESLRAGGHEVIVLSPRTPADSIGGRIGTMERVTRLDRLRLLGATVVDWDREDQLPVAIARSVAREVR